MGFVFVVGGARSGKSDRAQRLAIESTLPVTFIATGTAGDAEMEERIRRHRSARPHDWSTIEEPIDLQAAIEATSPIHFLIVDCLTLWVSNLLGAGWRPDEIEAAARSAAAALAGRTGVVVSNEVGLGIVPANELGRTFRDVLGAVNAHFSACADRSVLMVAGRAIELT
ncbi:MAG TPA: bifunctional adenosylcobinamide kinase/adenosylcobinamide-phosphate guanylyltransferase [Candidatus Limnocylindrales bacterium]|nr:bifunctional adenosylcobinamide kinase/adenosylcobinamide-phosphate guanylyltransferase [Candidatus Limnocylindrales bacterium]